MRILPSQQLLAIWRATVDASLRDGRWTWGGRHGRDSVSDAEQLLCILAPAVNIPALKLDWQDTTPAALDALQRLGDKVEIPRAIVTLLYEYFDRYTDQTGAPVFTAHGYITSTEPGVPPTAGQRSLTVVTSYTTAVKLCLAAIGFVRVFRTWVTNEQLRSTIDAVERAASIRLSAAMVGLLRSFCVFSFDAASPFGIVLCRMLANDDLPAEHVPARIRAELRDVIAGFHEVTIGSGQAIDLDRPDRLFECGWSWGVIKDAPTIVMTVPIAPQPDGTAVDAPYVHFTVAAMDAVSQLFSDRTRQLGLLNEEQALLSSALRLRFDLTRDYWAALATFGDAGWPLEDPPWRATDNVESDYFSLLVASLTITGLTRRRGLLSPGQEVTDNDWSRIAAILTEMASRGRITRRPLANDPALAYHSPGPKFHLIGSEAIDGGPILGWTLNDYSPMLLECAAQALTAVRDTHQRSRLSQLVDQIWRHLEQRRIIDGPCAGLWDQPAQVFPVPKISDELPSWFYTYRVVECLISTVYVVDSAHRSSQPLANLSVELLAEAEYLYDRLMLRTSTSTSLSEHAAQTLDAASATLTLARKLHAERPGSALALALEVLRNLTALHGNS